MNPVSIFDSTSIFALVDIIRTVISMFIISFVSVLPSTQCGLDGNEFTDLPFLKSIRSFRQFFYLTRQAPLSDADIIIFQRYLLTVTTVHRYKYDSTCLFLMTLHRKGL